MTKQNIKVWDLYTHNGNTIVITAIHGGNIYAADPIFDETGDIITGFNEESEKLLTDYEIKNLTY